MSSALYPPSSSVTVGAWATFHLNTPCLFALQMVAANDDGRGLSVHLNGYPVQVEEIRGPEPYARQHLVRCDFTGYLTIDYKATVSAGSGTTSVVDRAEWVTMLRPSRFCPSDRFTGFGERRIPGPDVDPLTRLQAITEYVNNHLEYIAGSTGPLDDAVDVLLSGRGVCRDYAHMVVTLARAAGMAARLVAVYAPGLSPMDFHAVAEVDVNGVWHVVDATRLAPRESLVRISTGRDAADTAWATTIEGDAQFGELSVTAVADNGLPYDDGSSPTRLS